MKIPWLVCIMLLLTGPSHGDDSSAALERFQKRHPGAQVLHEDGRLSRLYGTTMAFGATPERAAAAFVETHQDLLRVFADELVHTQVQPIWVEDDGTYRFSAVHFNQTRHGVSVYSAGLTLLVRHDLGNAVVLASCRVFDLRQMNPFPPKAGLPNPSRKVRQEFPQLALESPELVIDPRGDLPRYAYRFTGRGDRPETSEAYEFLVDAETGDVLERNSLVYHDDVRGVVRGRVMPLGGPNEEPITVPLPDLRVKIGGGKARFSNAKGGFRIPHEDTRKVRVFTQVTGTGGRWIRVVSHAAPGFSSAEHRVKPPGPATLLINPDPSPTTNAQADCYYHGTRVHDFVESIHPEVPGLDSQLVCNVNISQTCSAFYNNAINFGIGGNGCPNSAYSTVIYHEFGHHVVTHPYRAAFRSQPTQAYHEAMADLAAHLGYDTHCLFFGYSGPRCSRSSINNETYPCTNSSVHICGLPLTGAFWDLLNSLKNHYASDLALAHVSKLWLNSILLLPNDISPALTADVLTLDDDDGDLSNGTPHFPEIAQAFARHGLPTTLTPTNSIPCAAIQGLATACAPKDRLVARLLLRDNSHNGETVLMTIDGQPFEVEIKNRKARVVDCCHDPGRHTVTVRQPMGCIAPRTFECPAD